MIGPFHIDSLLVLGAWCLFIVGAVWAGFQVEKNWQDEQR